MSLLLSLPIDVLLEIFAIKELNDTLSSKRWFRVCKTLYELKEAIEDACMRKNLECDAAALRVCRLILDMRYTKVDLFKKEYELLIGCPKCNQNGGAIIPFKKDVVTNRVNSFIDAFTNKVLNGVLFVYYNDWKSLKQEYIKSVLFFLMAFHEIEEALRPTKPYHVLCRYRSQLCGIICESSKLINTVEGKPRIMTLQPYNSRFCYEAKRRTDPIYLSSSNKQIPRFIISLTNMYRSIIGDTNRDYLDSVYVHLEDDEVVEGYGVAYIDRSDFRLVSRKARNPKFNHFYSQ